MSSIRRFFRCFLISGFIGMAVALLLYLLGNISYTRAFTVRVATVLSPEMFLGLAEPTSLEAIVLLVVFVFGTNFVLYGVVGTLIWGVWSLFRSEPDAAR